MARSHRGRLPSGGRPLSSLGAALLLAAIAATPASAQLTPGGPRWPDALPTGSARGDASERQVENPALVGLQPRVSVAWSLPALELRAGLDPVSLFDVGGAPDPVPHALRERWLARIEARGHERGDASALVRWGAASGAGWAVSLGSAAWMRARLDPDAAELLFFGNAGRTGEPRALAPDGAVDAALLSTLTAAAGREIDAPWRGRTAVGAAAALSVGHGVWVARDAGSLAIADPPILNLRFPLLEGGLRAGGGTGAALHLGAAWESEPWSAGVSVTNVLARFRWRREGMTVRAGEAVLGPNPPDVDNDPRPVDEAPAALLVALDSVRPPTEIALAVARRWSPDLRLAAGARARASGGIAGGPRATATIAAEWMARSALPIYGAAELGDGLALGIAAEPELGGWLIRVGGGLGVAGARRDWTLTVGARRAPTAGG